MLAKFVKPWWMSLFKLIIECLFTNCVTPAAIGAQHELPVLCSIQIYPNIVQGFLYCVHCYLKDPLTRTSQQQIPNLSNMNKWFVWEIKGFIFNLSDNPDLINCLSILISRPHLLVVFRIWFESQIEILSFTIGLKIKKKLWNLKFRGEYILFDMIWVIRILLFFFLGYFFSTSKQVVTSKWPQSLQLTQAIFVIVVVILRIFDCNFKPHNLFLIFNVLDFIEESVLDWTGRKWHLLCPGGIQVVETNLN